MPSCYSKNPSLPFINTLLTFHKPTVHKLTKNHIFIQLIHKRAIQSVAKLKVSPKKQHKPRTSLSKLAPINTIIDSGCIINKSNMSLLKAVKQRLNQIPDNVNIEQLDLSEIKILRFDEETKKYLEKCKKIKYLVMQKCGLQSLENLPRWKLTAIDVSENKYN